MRTIPDLYYGSKLGRMQRLLEAYFCTSQNYRTMLRAEDSPDWRVYGIQFCKCHSKNKKTFPTNGM